MYNLTQFSLRDMTECGAAVRKLGQGQQSMEETAGHIAQYFYDNFIDPETEQPEFALTRFFKTHNLGELPHNLQEIAQNTLGTTQASAQMKCLTLLGTQGDCPAWCHRTSSAGHQVIPLPSEQMVTNAPMISQLIQQLGLSINSVISPASDLIVDLQERTFNVFHIPQAQGSLYIPAQADFVQPFNIQSVLGFGGILPSGNLIAIILFSKTPINRQTAELFKPLALNVKMAVLAFDHGTVFGTRAS